MNAPARFNGIDIWHGLNEDQKALIGSAAIEMIGAALVAQSEDEIEPVPSRAAAAATFVVGYHLQAAVADVLPVDLIERSAIGSLLGDICQHCGCTENDACEGPCWWVRPGLCSACAPKDMRCEPC